MKRCPTCDKPYITDTWYLKHINKFKSKNKGKLHILHGKIMEQSSLVKFVEN